MAATDQTYRDQKRLDTVFGVSCVLMLISIIWMFWDDYDREWKKEQRVFRDVEVAISDRSAMAKLPDPRFYIEAERDLDIAEDQLKKPRSQSDLEQIEEDMKNLRPPLLRSDERARTIKADLDSRKSFYDLEVEHNGPNSYAAKQYKKDIEDLEKKLAVAQDEFDKNKKEMQRLLNKKSKVEEPVTLAKAKVKSLRENFEIQVKNAKQKRWKFNDWFRALPIIDAFNSPLRIQQYTLNDLPIDYNFKYVTRYDRCTTCHQGIDRPGYEKEALRGLYKDPTGNRLAETTDRIARLEKEIRRKKKGKEDVKDLENQLKREKRYQDKFKELLDEIHQNFEPKKVTLSEGRVNEFSVHPRLDLFVDVNSPHGGEKFGCTICHGGQGSATDFFYASHTPGNAATKERWQKDHGWKPDHDWDFPMQPMRFVETSCLKCHHQVIDLIRDGNRNEAPKLVRGYNLVRENGCFGCHEIAGIKGGQSVGPDLRLEPFPPLEDMSAEERAKANADPLNPPGTMRKVGPSLYRISEKTHPNWVKRWIKAPREFRPTTRMPHFYNLSNNDKKALQDTGQEKFPDAEIDSIAHFLFYESQGYLDNIDTARKQDFLNLVGKFRKVYEYDKKTLEMRGKKNNLSAAEEKQLATAKEQLELLKDFEQFLYRKAPADPKKRAAWKKKELVALQKQEKKLGLLQRTSELLDSIALNDQDKKDLKETQRRIEVRGEPMTLAPKFAESMGKDKLPATSDKKAIDQQVLNGRRLFTQKGCLACHSHQAVTKAGPALMLDLVDPKDPKKVKEVTLPAIDREKYFKDQPTFGPNLSMLREKLGTDDTGKDYASKRRWLIQWILDPTFHSPRTLMPHTHLTFEEAAAVAAWLLQQEVTETGAGWDKVKVPEPDLKTLQALASQSLLKFMSKDDIQKVYQGDYGSPQGMGLPLDEVEMIGMIKESNSEKDQQAALKWYIGRKAVGRLGCFGCHNIPGFDYAKSIGTPLNDWGKKDPERLAFEDIKAYVKDHYDIVDSLTTVDKRTKKTIPRPLKGKNPKAYYESFFYDALKHHAREGFLQQKLREPRSYDYNRIRPWDERLRMPQFKFARTKRVEAESDEAFDLRKSRSPTPDKLKQRVREADLALQSRAEFEETEAREAVMTFILGLVAEAIPAKFINDPPPERLAAINGRKVLDKFNCASCHLVQPGTYDFKLTPEVIKELNTWQDSNQQSFAGDYGNSPSKQPHSYPFFAEHNAWKSQTPLPKERLTVHGIIKDLYEDPSVDETKPMIITTEALRYPDGKKINEVRAFGLVPVPFDAKTKEINTKLMSVRSPILGGNFADLLSNFLIQVHKDQSEYKPDTSFQDNGYARAGSPPSLFREGEKVQPNWLFEFLRHPEPIRPMARLRMPRFNMSDAEAVALVNYFAAEAKRANPNIGLTYPYSQIPQREDNFLAEQTRKYIGRYKKENQADFNKRIGELMKDWQQQYDEQIKTVEQEVANAKQDLKLASDDEKRKTATSYLERVTARLKELKETNKNTFAEAQKQEFESREAYAIDGYRLLTNRNLCLNCHQVGNQEASNPESQRGPPLQLAQYRLRPDWTLRWLANPQRFLTYTSVMPQYFRSLGDNEKPLYQELFTGSPFEQATAVRDVLMNFSKVVDMPANRSRPRPAAAGGG